MSFSFLNFYIVSIKGRYCRNQFAEVPEESVDSLIYPNHSPCSKTPPLSMIDIGFPRRKTNLFHVLKKRSRLPLPMVVLGIGLFMKIQERSSNYVASLMRVSSTFSHARCFRFRKSVYYYSI